MKKRPFRKCYKIDENVESVFKDIVNRIYVKCHSTMTVRDYLMKKFNIQISRAYEVIREAKDYFAEYIHSVNNDALGECLSVLENNREEAKKVGDLKEVRESTKEIAKLNQLYIQQLEIKANIEQPMFGKPQDTDGE